MNEGKVHGNKIPEQQSMIIILRNKRVIDKIKTETAVMKRVLSTVDSWCVTDGVRKEKERLTAACDSISILSGSYNSTNERRIV